MITILTCLSKRQPRPNVRTVVRCTHQSLLPAALRGAQCNLELHTGPKTVLADLGSAAPQSCSWRIATLVQPLYINQASLKTMAQSHELALHYLVGLKAGLVKFHTRIILNRKLETSQIRPSISHQSGTDTSNRPICFVVSPTYDTLDYSTGGFRNCAPSTDSTEIDHGLPSLSHRSDTVMNSSLAYYVESLT